MEEAPDAQEPSSSDHDEDESQQPIEGAPYGCSHYVRRCKLVCPDCDRPYWCRHCHDAEMENERDPKQQHPLDRSKVKEIVCGQYTCLRCPFYDDRVGRQYFHCDACGICRVGGRENFFHCPTCEGCFAKSLENNHTCVERNLKQNCPVCWEYQFDSIMPNTVLPCGHTIHVHCLEQLEQNAAGVVPMCPICKKSLGDYSQFWTVLDREIERMEVPEEYAGWLADAQCNDCGHTTRDIPFNLIALKCAQCGSYNTSRQRLTMPSGDRVEED